MDELIHAYNSGFQMDEKYSKRVDDTFLYRDGDNCKRVLSEVLKLSSRR